MLAVNPLRERLVEDIRQPPDTKLAEVLEDLRQCIRQPNPAPLGAFRLNLSDYHFDREEANAR
jgi:hypothetical protein